MGGKYCNQSDTFLLTGCTVELPETNIRTFTLKTRTWNLHSARMWAKHGGKLESTKKTLKTDVLVNGWLDFVDVLDHLLDDQLLVGGHAVVDRHHLRAHVGVDFGRDVIPGSEMLGFEILKLLLAFLSVRFNFSLGFFLSLLETACFPFAGLGYFIGGSLLSGQQLLNSLRLASHLKI